MLFCSSVVLSCSAALPPRVIFMAQYNISPFHVELKLIINAMLNFDVYSTDCSVLFCTSMDVPQFNAWFCLQRIFEEIIDIQVIYIQLFVHVCVCGC